MSVELQIITNERWVKFYPYKLIKKNFLIEFYLYTFKNF